MTTLTIDDGDSRFSYGTSTWRLQENTEQASADGYHNGTYHTTCNNGDSMTLTWEGTGVTLWHGARPNKGYYSILLDTRDANQKQYLDGYSDKDQIPAVMFNVTGLNYGTHTLVWTNEKDYNTTRYGCNGIDYADLLGVPEGSQPQYGPPATSSSASSAANSVSASSSSTSSDLPQVTGLNGNYTFITTAPDPIKTTFQTTTNTKTAIGPAGGTMNTDGVPKLDNSPVPTTMPVVEGNFNSGAMGSYSDSGHLMWFVIAAWVFRLFQ